MDIEKYIEKQLNCSGGACWSINILGLAHVDFCFRERGLKIFYVNVKLFILWILRKY